MRSRKKKTSAKKSKARLKPDSAHEQELNPSILEPSLTDLKFNNFEDMAQGFDALIHEFYRYYNQNSHEEPNLFGFVSVTHRVKFENIDCLRTENAIGEKTTIIYAPILPGESAEERMNRELKILAAFEPSKRSSHIMALSLLLGMLGKNGLSILIDKQKKKKGQKHD